MRAVRLDQFGPPENLKVVECSVPAPGDDDVLIKIDYAGLIYGDAEARRGTYLAHTTVPWYPGRDIAGVVEKVGRNVRGITPGTRVAALLPHGTGCAEYALAWTRGKNITGGNSIPPSDIVPIPDNVSSTQALVYLINYRLAYFLYQLSAHVPDGAAILIHGAAGGMGSMLIQLAHERGCEIFACHRTPEEGAFCKRIGATHLVDVSTVDYESAVLDLTGGKGVAFSFNGVGGSTVNNDWKIVAPFGEIMLYGYVAGKVALQVFDIARTVALKTFSADDFFAVPDYVRAATDALLRRFRDGPLIDVTKVFSLDEVAIAHRWLDEGRVIGKIALKP
jgi:NADPH2:quinone reductase